MPHPTNNPAPIPKKNKKNWCFLHIFPKIPTAAISPRSPPFFLIFFAAPNENNMLSQVSISTPSLSPQVHDFF